MVGTSISVGHGGITTASELRVTEMSSTSDFAHSRPYLLTDVPEAISQALREYLRVDSVPKKDKQAKMIAGMRKAMPLRRTVRDLLDARKVMT